MPIPRIEKQQMSKWCWASCTIFVCRLYNSNLNLTQKILVANVLQKPFCRQYEHFSCNDMHDLGNSLDTVNHLHRTIQNLLAPEQIIQYFSNGGKAIGCQVRFPAFSHAVIIADAKYNSAGSLFLYVADPGTGGIHTVDYHEFCTNYLLRAGRWIRTYLTI